MSVVTLGQTQRPLLPGMIVRAGLLRYSFPVMGTQASVVIATHQLSEEREAINAAAALRGVLDAADERFSPYRADSELVRFREDRTKVLSPQFQQVMDHCRGLKSQTGGAFDPYDGQGRYDPTGYVKGWAGERAVRAAVESGASDVCLTVGGDVRTSGIATVGRPWQIAVRSPSRPGAVVAMVKPNQAGASLAIATSGEYERGGHIWSAADPKPGMRPGHVELGSATVVGPDLGMADAYSTAIWSAAKNDGVAAALQLLESIPGYETLLVTPNQRVISTTGLPDFLVGRVSGIA